MSANAALSLKTKTVPLSLQAYKAKIKLVERSPRTIIKNAHRHSLQSEQRVLVAAEGKTPPAKDPRPGSKGPLPFVVIPGAIYPGENSWADGKSRAAALNQWAARIAKEVGRQFDTQTEREAATAFAQSHRLSIVNAFARRLVRADVVAELTRLYRLGACG